MSVVVGFEDVGPCRKQLKVEVPAPAVEAETARVVREYGRQVRLPGFRKGKVPSTLVLQRFREEIDREIVDRLVPRYWRQAEAEKSLDPILAPKIESVDLQPGSSLVFVATVEVRPQIELSDDRDYDLPEVDVEPSDDEVEEIVGRMRTEASPWNAADRPATQGDRVSLGVLEVGAAEEEDAEWSPLEIEVGDSNVWEELSLAVAGLAEGQEGTFERSEPEEGGEQPQSEDAPARTRSFRVQVREVRERDLLPLDDSLAKKLGDFEDLASLREEIRQRLRDEKTREARQRREEALLDQLRDRHPLALPEGVVEQELEEMLHDYAHGLTNRGVDLENTGIDWQAMAGQARPLAEKRVHARLILDAFAAADDVQVSEQEFEAMLASIARAQGKSTVAVRQALDQSGRLAGLRAQLRRRKVVLSLLGEEEAGEDNLVAAGSGLESAGEVD